MNKNYFTHLNVQSNCNVSFSSIFIDDLVSFALSNNLKVLSLSEINPYGFVKFFELCKKNKIKPIWGIKRLFRSNDCVFFVNFFPSSYKDYIWLNKFFLFNSEEKKELTLNCLRKLYKHCIIVFEVKSEEEAIISKTIKENLKESLLEDSDFELNLYIGINFFPIDIMKFLEKVDIEDLLLFFSIKFIKKNDEKFIFLLKNTDFVNNFLKEEIETNFFSFFDKSYFLENLKIERENEYFGEFKEKFFQKMIEQNDKFSKVINLSKRDSKITREKQNKKEFILLKEKCLNSLENMEFGKPNLTYDSYKKVLEKELSIIDEMNYSSYFMNVSQIINLIRRENVEVGPGRGSAVSSLVSYLLDITSIDPVKHGLFFWRFLNSKREKYPDIDIDVENQEKVLKIIQDNYGIYSVSKIILKKKVGWSNALKFGLRFFGVDFDDSIFIENNSEKFEKFEECYYRYIKINFIYHNYREMFNFVKKCQNWTHPLEYIHLV